MNAIQRSAFVISKDCESQPQEIAAAKQDTNSPRVLSQKEIEAVAGGPEGEVGSGLTPPR